MSNTGRILITLLLVFVSGAAARAQDADKGDAAPNAVTIAVAAEGVRFVSHGAARQTRVEVFDDAGASVFNSGFLHGNVRDWPLTDQQGGALADGTYLCVVTVRDASGKLRVKQGNVLVYGGRASLQLTEAADAGTVETVQMHAAPGATFETATNDAAGNVSATSSSEGDTPPGPSAAGTGTQNRLAKWAETGGAGTLTDSSVFETGGFVGVGTAAPEGTLHIQSPGTTVFKSVSTGTAATGRSVFQMYRGAAATANGWDLGYNLDLASENFILRELTNGATTTRLTVGRGTGNVGIGVGAPTQKLEVGGNLKLTGAGSAIIFPDGTLQTTAGGGGGGGGGVSGSGTMGRIPLWSSSNALGDSVIFEGGGNVGVGTPAIPTARLRVAGLIDNTAGGVKFPDGTIQTTATAQGPTGPAGPQGPAGPPGPAVHTSAVCTSAVSVNGSCQSRICSCPHGTVSTVSSPCTVTSDTGSCSASSCTFSFPAAHGQCCVCKP